MSEARQAAERAAEQLIPRAPLRDESDAEFVEIMEDIRKEHVARAVPIIESEIAPLLAAKDAEIDRLAEQLEMIDVALAEQPHV